MKQIAAVELERCEALADLLDLVEPEVFDLRAWVTQLPRVKKTAMFGLIETRPACGFAGCAMGWAAYEQIFPGFRATTDGSVVYQREGMNPLMNWEAVRAVTGLNKRMAYYLFYPRLYKTNPSPAMVADRLRRFIRKIEAIRARDRRRAAPERPRLELVA